MEQKNDTSGTIEPEEVIELKPNEKIGLWEGIKRHFKSYCEISTIQGLNYMVKDGVSKFERAWWIIIFVLCVGGCSYMVYELIYKWITTPVLVSLATKETSIREIPFPAVTICPEIKISNKCLNYTNILKKRKNCEDFDKNSLENIYFDYMSVICKLDNHDNSICGDKATESSSCKDEKLLNQDYAQFFDECKSVSLDLAYCEWMGKSVKCKDILTPILTDEGMCYSFNMFDVRDIYTDINQMKYYPEGRRNPNWNVETGYPEDKIDNVFPRRAFLNGAENSLVVALLTKKSDIFYSCRDFALQGVRVSLHMPARIPRPSQVFFSVGLDRLTSVAVIPTLMSTTSAIKEYDPQKRSCYFTKERPLKYFKLYTQSNCNMECWTNFTIGFCGCTDFYMPRDANTSVCCLEKRSCLEKARLQYPIRVLTERLNKDDETSYCNCLPVCTDLNYNSEISSGIWQFNEDLDQHFIDYHASAIKVFFKNSFFLPTEKSELYGITDFISNSGGILGLFTGFSLFSLAEIIYYLSVKLIENHRQHGHWAGEATTNDENIS